MRQAAEERNAFSDEHGDTRDDEALNEARAQELLNRDSAVDVEVAGAAGGELRNDLSLAAPAICSTTLPLACGRQIERAATQDHYALVIVGPCPERQNGLEGVAAHHDGIHAGDEFVVAMGFAAIGRQKSKVPSRRAMKPSRLVPTKTDAVIGVSGTPIV